MEQAPRTNSNANWLWVILLVIIANLVQLPLLQLSRGSLGHHMLWTVIYLGGFILAVGLAGWRYHRISPDYHRLTRHDWGVMVGAYVFIIVVEELLNLLNYFVFHQTSTANNQAISGLLQRSPWILILMSLTAICASPFLEEFTFRGILMRGCFARNSFWLPIIVSAIAFSLVHLSTTPISWLLYAAMGGAFAYVYQRTGKIQSTILMHAFNNLLAMSMMWLTLR